MIGTRLAHYEITNHIGTGGMGEVYQATDSKLGRSVAIKVVSEAFSHDSERIARFAREARASLNQISTGGGTLPQWRRDGKELFYMGSDGRLMALPISFNGSKVELGTPVALFSVSPGSLYAAMPDGQTFLVNGSTPPPSPITILQNWKPSNR